MGPRRRATSKEWTAWVPVLGFLLAMTAPGSATDLVQPRGLALDSQGRLLVADPGKGTVLLFDPEGRLVMEIGRDGEGDSLLHQPWDVAFGPEEEILVLDREGGRVMRYDSKGHWLGSVGEPGTEPGRLYQPCGLAVDLRRQEIYVADTGNHRVQRFRRDGSLDSSWGSSGGIGRSGRGHGAFDRPRSVTLTPSGDRVVVADFGNCRLEVFDRQGRYRETYYGVYRPTGMAFSAGGDLYAVGEDPATGFRRRQGRVRRYQTGDRLPSEQYFGWLDDLGNCLGDVEVSADGSWWVSDVQRGRIVRGTSDMSEPVRNLSIQPLGDEIIVSWTTRESCCGTVRFGETKEGRSQRAETNPTTRHSVRIDGLEPGHRLALCVSYPDSFDGRTRWTKPWWVGTGPPPGMTQFLTLRAVGLIYADTEPGRGYRPLDPVQLENAWKRFDRLAEFYWINSRCRLWLDIRPVIVNRDLICPAGGKYKILQHLMEDLTQAGFGPDDDLDAAWGTSPLADGNFGGEGRLFGRKACRSQWVTATDFVAAHEIHHSIDRMLASIGVPQLEFCHGLWGVFGSQGKDVTALAQTLRNLPEAQWLASRKPYDGLWIAPDADGDGLPDVSPAGLGRPLRLTEAGLGSSPGSVDTDGDGISDRDELLALPFHGTDLTRTDSDGDGVPDGQDLNPLYPIRDRIQRGAPQLDGRISRSEGWTRITHGWGFSNQGFGGDDDACQGRASIYAAWDDRFLYLATSGPMEPAKILLDGNADGYYQGPDGYHLTIEPGKHQIQVGLNVGLPDVMFMVDGDGQYSELIDRDRIFTRPYPGRPPHQQDGEGLGFPRRLVREEDLRIRFGQGADRCVWEAALPWSDLTQMRGGAGHRLALSIRLGKDRIFETDHMALLELVGL